MLEVIMGKGLVLGLLGLTARGVFGWLALLLTIVISVPMVFVEKLRDRHRTH